LPVKPKRAWPAIATSLTILALTGCGQPAHPAASSAAPPRVSASPTSAAPAQSTASPSYGPNSTSASQAPNISGAPCVTHAAKGSCGPYSYAAIAGSGGSSTYVLNDMWAANKGTTQTLGVWNPGRWSAVANAGPAGYTGVQTYPDVQQIYTRDDNSPDPLSGFGSIRSSFTENMHATRATSAEAAYDIWLGQGSSTNYADEVMVWNDTAHRGTCGGAVVKAHASFGGSHGVSRRNWTLCQWDGKELIWYLAKGNERSGTVNLLAMLTWLETHGYLPAGSGLNQIDYGFEICSTHGPETFTVSRFTISST
jgi:hypothetical protein